MIRTMTDQRKTISINPANGDRNPKKNTDQSPFNTSWIKNNIRALRRKAPFSFLFQIMNKEMPMRV